MRKPKPKSKARRDGKMSIEDVMFSPFDREAMKAWHRRRKINAAMRAKRIANFKSPFTSQVDIESGKVRAVCIPPKS